MSRQADLTMIQEIILTEMGRKSAVVANKLDLDQNQFLDQLNPNNRAKLGLQTIREYFLRTGNHGLLHSLAAENGYALFPVPEIDCLNSPTDIRRETLSLFEKVADVIPVLESVMAEESDGGTDITHDTEWPRVMGVLHCVHEGTAGLGETVRAAVKFPAGERRLRACSLPLPTATRQPLQAGVR